VKETTGSIARLVGGRVMGDESHVIRGVAPIETAGPDQVTFLSNPKYLKYLKTTSAGSVIVDREELCRPGKPDIVVPDPYLAFQKISSKFFSVLADFKPGIHPTAVVDPGVKLGTGVCIGPFSVIMDRARIGNDVKIGCGVFIGSDVVVGDAAVIYSNAVIRERVEIGRRVIIQPGAVIGSDGFGFARENGKFKRIPQVGKVVIEDDVEIGANATIDRGTMDDTIIRSGVKLDNLVHIAHNVVVGPDSAMAALVGIAGSTVIGKGVLFGGQSGAVDHITIGDGAVMIAQTGVTKSVPGNQVYAGFPSRPQREFNKAMANIRRIDKLIDRVKKLEERLSELERG